MKKLLAVIDERAVNTHTGLRKLVEDFFDRVPFDLIIEVTVTVGGEEYVPVDADARAACPYISQNLVRKLIIRM
jgi:hypothetical protein